MLNILVVVNKASYQSRQKRILYIALNTTVFVSKIIYFFGNLSKKHYLALMFLQSICIYYVLCPCSNFVHLVLRMVQLF